MNKALNKFLDWLISIVCYALILLLATIVFKKTIVIDGSYYGLWILIASVIIYILNKLVKPIIVWLTLPLTGLTMGIFYPFVNVIILYINDFIMGKHFEVYGILMAFLLAIFISLVQIILKESHLQDYMLVKNLKNII